MTKRNEAVGYYTPSELDRLRTAVEELVSFVEMAAPNDRERQRWTKVLELVRERLEDTLDATL